MRAPANIRFRQTGSGLLEVLVLIVVMAVGMLAMGKMHTVLIRDGGTANNRAVATAIAQEKIDDLRGFKWIDTGSPNTEGCGDGIFCYSEIADDAGGTQSGANLVIPSGSITVGNTAFNRAWTSVDNTTFKLVTVTVTWTDQNGQGQVQLETAIYRHDNNATALEDSGYGGGGSGPKVAYVPLGIPDTVAIEIGGGKSTETSKPLPTVEGGASKTVAFPSVTYEFAIGGGYQLTAQEDFRTVNCTCTLEASGTGWTPHRMVWDPTKTNDPAPAWEAGEVVDIGTPRTNAGNLYSSETSGTTGSTAPTHTTGSDSDGSVDWLYIGPAVQTGALVLEYGHSVTKPVGIPNDLDVQGRTSQSDLCIECCRDHHDVDDYPTYRPYIAHTDFANNGDHKHYQTNGTSIANVDDDYVEACRMKRIDGLWKVVPDWLLIDLVNVPCDYFASQSTTQCPPSGANDSTKLTAYRSHVRNVLKAFVNYENTNKAVDTSSSDLPTFTNGVSALLDTSSSSDDVSVTNGGTKQLIARGLYADLIFMPLTFDADGSPTGTPRAIDQTYVTAILPIAASDDFSKLQRVPFYDTNLTLLAIWTPTSTDTAGSADVGDCSLASPTYGTTPSPSGAVCVTSEVIVTIDDPNTAYYDDYYSRGKLHGKLVSGSTLITASIARGNTGLTNSISINGSAAPTLTSQVKATIPVSGNTLGVSGTVTRANISVDLSSVQIAATPSTGVTCNPTNPGGVNSGTSVLAYTCTVPDPWTGILSFSSTTAGYLFDPSTSASITAPDPAGNVLVYGPTAIIGGVINTSVNNPVVSMAISGSPSGATCTGAYGTGSTKKDYFYTCTMSRGWTGIVTPTFSGHTITPASKAYTNVQADLTSENYTAN